MTRTLIAQLGRDTGYVLLGYPLTCLSCCVLLSGLASSALLVCVFVGIPVAVLTLFAARGFAAVERARLRALDDRPVVTPGPLAPAGEGWQRWTRPLRDGRAWLEVLHGAVVAPVVATISASIVVLWYIGAIGGLGFPLWNRWAGAGTEILPDLLDRYPDRNVVLAFSLGAFFLVTLLPVVRLSARLQSAVARRLVASPPRTSLQARVDALAVSRSAVVHAGTATLQKLERDIHDGPQQRLVRLQMDLASAERRLADDPEAARGLVIEAQGQVSEALGELRSLSRGIAPPILVDRGLAAALSALAARCTVEVSVDVRLPDGARLPAQVESTAYFVVAEALTNVAKHSQATTCQVNVTSAGTPGKDAAVGIGVRDNGVGGAALAKGHGLAGLSDRVEGVDGSLSLSSPPGGPTVLTAIIPVS